MRGRSRQHGTAAASIAALDLSTPTVRRPRCSPLGALDPTGAEIVAILKRQRAAVPGKRSRHEHAALKGQETKDEGPKTNDRSSYAAVSLAAIRDFDRACGGPQ